MTFRSLVSLAFLGACALHAASTPANALLVLEKEQNTLVIVDPATLTIVARVPAGNDPHEVAVSDDGKRVAFGSFDGYVYGLDPANLDGPAWTVPARDHIYGSAALAADGTAYIGSADGTLYALHPDGTAKWAFDTLDPIRSSPAVAGDGTIYFGAGDGVLYALGADGRRKWSYDTSQSDRNDLNGSPALGLDGAAEKAFRLSLIAQEKGEGVGLAEEAVEAFGQAVAAILGGGDLDVLDHVVMEQDEGPAIGVEDFPMIAFTPRATEK